MKKLDVFVLLGLFLMSSLYSFTQPTERIDHLQPTHQMIVTIEGKYQRKMIFDHNPTIKEVFQQLNATNKYGFDNDYVLETYSLLFIPSQNNLISLNKATSEELKTLKGIGDVTASKIIEYRQIQRFETIEDIQKVSGIGEKTYYRLRDFLML